MNHPKLTIQRILRRKLVMLFLLALSAAGAFATLGDGRKKASTTSKKAFLSGRTIPNNRYFSLKSGYTFRGNQVINSNTDKKYINLNTMVSVHKGNTTYVLPLRKKALVDKVKIDIGNRQFKRN